MTTPLYTMRYTYGDASWGDLLTAYNGVAITYDEIGNPLNDGTWTYTWEHGRQMASMSNGTTTWDMTYNADGLRTGRTNGTNTYTYWYNESGQLVRMKFNSLIFRIAYGASGQPISISYNGNTYYYVLNQQGDVMALLDSSGNWVVKYTYDAWGNILTTTASTEAMRLTLAKYNPLRYRGYVYDRETGLYYLQSRYYNPEWGRFINADNPEIIDGANDSLLENNLFSYCFNNPVNMTDESGHWPSWAKKLVIGTAVIAAAAVLTVATAGTGTALACFAVGALKGAAVGAAMGAASGAVTGAVSHRVTTGSWKGAGTAALNGAADGYMTGAITGFVSGGLTSNACFIAGTAVLASTGYVAIETIQAGDYVWAADPETGEVALKKVVQTFVNEAESLVHVTVNGEEIICTDEHPFYSPVKGWTAACKLRAGDILVTVNGEYVVVEKIQHEILESPVTVYNFEVEGFHTYYVSNIAILVHNLCHNNQKTLWDIRKYSKGQQKVSFAGKNMTAHFDGTYYWLDDLAGHGTSQYKVFRKSGNYLEWVYDADKYGNFIIGKHKGPVGLRIKL